MIIYKRSWGVVDRSFEGPGSLLSLLISARHAHGHPFPCGGFGGKGGEGGSRG